jgi:hypothetical protein
MSIRVIAMLFLAALFLAMSGLMANALWANQTRQMSLEEKVRRSDLVIIGQAISDPNMAQVEFATIKPKTVLKGSPAPEIQVLLSDPIAENRINCCNVGGLYILFLKRIKANKYISSNGKTGVYSIE